MENKAFVEDGSPTRIDKNAQDLNVEENTEKQKPTPKIFCELQQLVEGKGGQGLEWREKARWVKFKEEVEEGGQKWSKPHVASLSLKGLFALKKGLTTGLIVFDANAKSMLELTDTIIQAMQKEKWYTEDIGSNISEVLLRQHKHLHESKRKLLPTLHKSSSNSTVVTMNNGDASMNWNSNNVAGQGPLPRLESQLSNLSVTQLDELNQCEHHNFQPNKSFMRKIPNGAEAAHVLVGEADFLQDPFTVFVRLAEPINLADLSSVPINTKFVFLNLEPKGQKKQNYMDIGQSMATLFADDIFQETAYTVCTREDLLCGMDEFMDSVVALPPSNWDPKIRIEPPQRLPLKRQKSTDVPDGKEDGVNEGHGDPTLKRTGRLFGGLIADIKRKLPWFLSDFKDGIHYQSIATIIYLYIASLTPIVTFGGLLGQATDNNMAAMEGILAGAITGITFALFAGQPLNIIGSTGPMLVFEKILYSLCRSGSNKLNFLSFRFWVGMWSALYLLIIVTFDLSSLVSYITRFTEESFAALIAIIFIIEAIEKLIKLNDKTTINVKVKDPNSWKCECVPRPTTTGTVAMENFTMTTAGMDSINMTTDLPISTTILNYANETTTELLNNCRPPISKQKCHELGGVLEGPGCKYVPDVFLYSILIFLGTFIIAMALRWFRNSPFFPSKVRQIFSDFGVIISIIIMVGIDAATGLNTLKLTVPDKFKPTRNDRTFIIPPFNGNPWWTAIAAAAPALLGTILIFLDQQITAVIVNRKENKLKKGSGYHLDIFVIAIQIAVCSLMGLPWFVASTVLAISHVMSLRKESESSAPGEKPQFLGVRENRLTALVMSILVFVSVYLTVVFKLIPMAVLYGVFLYMGITSLNGMQLIERILLVFMPAKYQPDTMYRRHVKTWRIHLFTLIQVLGLAVLWVIKSFKTTSILFPLMILAICVIRKLLDYVFTQRELSILDDILPEHSKRKKEDSIIKNEKEPAPNGLPEGVLFVPLSDDKLISVPAENVIYSPNTNNSNSNTATDSNGVIRNTLNGSLTHRKMGPLREIEVNSVSNKVFIEDELTKL